jgi:hypothetical protein
VRRPLAQSALLTHRRNPQLAECRIEPDEPGVLGVGEEQNKN